MHCSSRNPNRDINCVRYVSYKCIYQEAIRLLHSIGEFEKRLWSKLPDNIYLNDIDGRYYLWRTDMNISDHQLLDRVRRDRASKKQFPQLNETPFKYEGELAAGIDVRKSSIDGQGCFANAFFPRHGIIAEYRGERITNQ